MVDAEFKPSRMARLGLGALVALLHLAALAVLIRAFAPDIGIAVLGPVPQAFDVAITPPQPPEPPAAMPANQAAPVAQGAAAAAGRKATPRAVAAPSARIVVSPKAAPPVAATGNDDSAGASASGQGTGAGGAGQGLGAGLSGSGLGGGGRAAKPVKIAGDIVSTRDYPSATRDLRLGSAVTILLTITEQGRVAGCRVIRPSRDPEADQITCRLASERFRFRPALDASGHPVQATYGWQQRWFMPAAK
jgi:protein TonB